MPYKNHYAVLGVPQSASPEELRTAYRSLAKRYHPDAAPDNPYAAAHFAEISIAYEVLSDPTRRAAYDEERWLLGLSTRRKAVVRITPDWILNETARLRHHMRQIDTYRMNHAALKDYVLMLLSDEHLSVLQNADSTVRSSILDNLLNSVSKLHFRYADATSSRLKMLAGANSDWLSEIGLWEHKLAQEARWSKYQPAIILTATALLCVFLWWLSRGH